MQLQLSFNEITKSIQNGQYKNGLEVPFYAWAYPEWDNLSQSDAQKLFLPFFKDSIEQAREKMPKIYAGYRPNLKIETIDDFYHLPMLVKDSSSSSIGFRNVVAKDPFAMLPKGVECSIIFKSGGTKGVATPTFITSNDRLIESSGLKRCFLAMGMKKGDTILSTYNPTHKGGEIIKEAATDMGMHFIPRRTTDSASDVIQTIERYNVNILAAVQGPIAEGDQTKKGAGVDFISLVEKGQDVLESKVDTYFITGYKLIDEVIAWAETYGKNLATTLGSSEAIPQATSTLGAATRFCRYNNLHLNYGPHFVEVLKLESGTLVPVKKGETGILVYTTLAREGTRYIRYAPGDSAQFIGERDCPCGRKSPLITNIMRIDVPNEIVQTGCCIG